MDRSLYDDDIYAWSEQQAAALRLLAERPARLPNELDLVHVAEEIEDLGRSERHAAESALRLIMVHLIKLSADPEARAIRHWRSEIVAFHIELLSRLTRAMAGRIDLDQVWTQAKRQARAALDADEIEDAQAGLWALGECPFTLEQLSAPDLDIGSAVRQLSAESE